MIAPIIIVNPPTTPVDPVTGQPVAGGVDLDGDGFVDVVQLPATGETPYLRDSAFLGALAAIVLGLMGAGFFLRRRTN